MMIDCKRYNYHCEKSVLHCLSCEWYCISKISEKKTQPVITSNLFKASRDRSKLECMEKISRVFVQMQDSKLRGSRDFPIQLLQHEYYLLHILLRFHWISMRRRTRKSKLDQSFWKKKLESAAVQQLRSSSRSKKLYQILNHIDLHVCYHLL